jgi:hypothetical protein
VLANTARPVAGSSAPSLDLGAALAYRGTPPDANAGRQPTAFGSADWVTGLLQGNRAGWRSNSLTNAGWAQSTWTQSTWTQSTWTQSTWTQSTWTNMVGG